MNLHIIAIGRARAGPEALLYQHYAGRINRWPLALVERDLKKRVPEKQEAEAEAALLREAIPDDALVIALDERGRQQTSRQFASLIGDLQEEGRRDIAFVISGAGGLAPSLRDGADRVLSLGEATWPHLLVRGLLAEQIYRAQQILAGHPYHRD